MCKLKKTLYLQYYMYIFNILQFDISVLATPTISLTALTSPIFLPAKPKIHPLHT